MENGILPETINRIESDKEGYMTSAKYAERYRHFWGITLNREIEKNHYPRLSTLEEKSQRSKI